MSSLKKGWMVDTPAFTAYLRRIDAEKISFKKGMVKARIQSETGGSYYRERATIRVTKTLDIAITGEHAKTIDPPTDAEREAIKSEFVELKEKLPKSINATEEQAETQRKVLKVKPEWWFPLRSFDRKEVIMVQEREEKNPNEKEYWPWSYYDNNRWARYEPDGDGLPFWKPKHKTNLPMLMVHEGAKAAHFADRLVNDPSWEKQRSEHPWLEFLGCYEHWGIIGGAEAPHRADYEELRQFAPGRLVYVCDRDKQGEAAAQKFSKLYQRKMDLLRFNETKFPPGWDVADPLPKSLFYNNDLSNVYMYDPPESMLSPATWATEIIMPKEGEKGRPQIKLRDEFIEEWYHSVKPEVYIHSRYPENVYTSEEFNNKVSPFAETDYIAEKLKKYNASKVDTVTYIPGHVSGGTTHTEFGLAFNTHTPTKIKPVEGDISPWIEYIENVFPLESDQKELIRWCYTLIARLDIKMSYGLLLCSETQGVGKTTLPQNVLAPLVGHRNVKYPSESDICSSNFTDWKANARLLVVNEIYAGHSSKAYDTLKDLITDRWIRINGKYMQPYNQENWSHIIACSNSMRALKLPDDDRRWQIPSVTEKVLPATYWNEFNRWLQTGGLEAILFDAQQWSRDYPDDVIMHGDRAPNSGAKQKMIEASYSTGMALVADWLEEHRDGEPLAITIDALIDYIRKKIYDGRHSDKLERPSTIKKVARHKGWFGGDIQTFVSTDMPKSRLLVNRAHLDNSTVAQIANEGVDVIIEYDGIDFVSRKGKSNG